MAISDLQHRAYIARFKAEVERQNVYASLVNREYEGDIRGGARTVQIPSYTGSVTIRDYNRTADLGAYDVANATTQTMTIDQEKAWRFYIEDVDQAQSHAPLMSGAMTEAAKTVAEHTDDYLKGVLQTGRNVAANLESSTTAFASVTDGYLPQFRALKNKMQNANLWDKGEPFVVVNPNVIENIEKSLQTGGATALYVPAAIEETMRNGFAGKWGGFNLYLTTNVTTASGNYRCMAGIKGLGASYAEQIIKTETYRLENRFADGVKGLLVYGSLVTENERLFELQVKAKA